MDKPQGNPRRRMTLLEAWALDDANRSVTRCWICRHRDKDFHFGSPEGKCSMHPDGVPKSKSVLLLKDVAGLKHSDIDKWFKEHICEHFEKGRPQD